MRAVRTPLLALLVSACAPALAPAPTPARGRPVAPNAPRIAFAAPSLTARRLPLVRACLADPRSPSPDATDYGYGYEFDAAPLYPVAQGPRVEEMPRGEGLPRTLDELYDAIGLQAPLMNTCYRWARSHSAGKLQAATVQVELQIDPFGLVRHVSAEGGGNDLDGCVADVLRAVSLERSTARATLAKVRLAFAPAALNAPLDVPSRPKVEAASLPPICVEREGPMPTDELEQPGNGPFVTFDDWTAQREQIDWQRAHPGKRRPRVYRDCTAISGRMPPQAFQRALASNKGALQTCYAAARQANPSLSGRLAVTYRVDAEGVPKKVDVEAPSGDLATCVRAAIEQVRVPFVNPDVTVTSRHTFTLEPPPAPLPAEPAERGKVLIERGDAVGAVEAFVEVVRRNADGDACMGRLGILRAMLARAPWVDDPRVWAALDDFVAVGPTLPASSATNACLEEAAPVVAEVATFPFALDESGVRAAQNLGRFASPIPGSALVQSARERVDKLLRRWPRMPGHATLRELEASAILATDPWDVAEGRLPALLLGIDDERAMSRLVRMVPNASQREQSRGWNAERGETVRRFGFCE
jgi:hypothetical protein